jgi:hypothetical protein
VIRFLGAFDVITRFLYYYFQKVVWGTALRTYSCIDFVRYGYIEQGHSTISMANPSDNGTSDAFRHPPIFGYTLKLMCFLLFMCNSYLIMNMFMFNRCLNNKYDNHTI